MIDKMQIIKDHLKDCDSDQLHEGSYVSIRECIEMMDILEQKLTKTFKIN